MKIEDALMSKPILSTILLLFALLLIGPGAANAVSSDFLFSSGQMTLRAELDDATNTSILSDPDPAIIPLGGSFVRFDPAASPNGTLIAFSMIPSGQIDLDLDETVTTLDSISILSAVFTEAAGATADLNGFGQFTIDSMMTAEVSGVFADTTPFGPAILPSLESVATGFLFIAAASSS